MAGHSEDQDYAERSWHLERRGSYAHTGRLLQWKGSTLVGLTRRAGQVMLAACALALVPATAATAATPVVSASKDRSAGDVTLGAVIIVVLLVLLFLAYRVIRGRMRG